MKCLSMCVKPLAVATFFSTQIFMSSVQAMQAGAEKASSSWGSYLRDTYSIVLSVVKHPTEVSAFTASSPWVVDTILSNVKSGNILEIGAGSGTISIPLLNNISLCPINRYDGVELEPELFRVLKRRVNELPGGYSGLISEEQRVYLYNKDFVYWTPDKMQDGQENGFYDTVISTIPITRLPCNVMQDILNKVNKLLKPGGIFIYVSLAGARSMGHWVRFFQAVFCSRKNLIEYERKLKFIDTWVQDNFEQHEVLVWQNITPMRVYVAVKKQ